MTDEDVVVGSTHVSYLEREIERFLIHEARLLDERQFQAWLDCLDDDLHYQVTSASMPLLRATQKAAPKISTILIDERKEHVVNRVRRLATGNAWAEEPPSRTRRIISNILVDIVQEGNASATSIILLHRSYGERSEVTFIAGRRDELKRQPDGRWLLAAREVSLDQHVLPASHISVII